jgi:hypothetical protein
MKQSAIINIIHTRERFIDKVSSILAFLEFFPRLMWLIARCAAAGKLTYSPL